MSSGESDTRACTYCQQVLPVQVFKFRSEGGRQKGQRHTMCNRCLYVLYTRPNAERKLVEVRSYKTERGCSDCGYNLHPAALEFDHRPGVPKSFNIGEKIGAYSRKKIWEEIAKCDVVCANCHAIRTVSRRTRVELAEPFSDGSAP